MVYDIIAAKMEGKVFFINFIEIFQSKMKRVHVNKSFYLIILEKIEDSILNYSQLSFRLYTLMTSFFTLVHRVGHKGTSCPDPVWWWGGGQLDRIATPRPDLGKVNGLVMWSGYPPLDWT